MTKKVEPLLVYALDDVDSTVERLADLVPDDVAVVETSTSVRDFVKTIKKLRPEFPLPAAVVLDAYLARQGGYNGALRAAKAIRKNPLTSKVPILIFSAFSHYIRTGEGDEPDETEIGQAARTREFEDIKAKCAKLKIRTETDYFDKSKDAAGHPDLEKGIEELIDRLRSIQRVKADQTEK